jgi:AcrR family transcriptional regulator
MINADRRVQKTRRLLQDALVELIAEKGFASVTIQEILDRANVGRSTFYMHYDNKNELLHSCFEDFCNLLEKHNRELADVGKQVRALEETDYIYNFLRFVEQNRRLLKALLGKESMPMFHQYIHDYVYSFVDGYLKAAVLKGKKSTPRIDGMTHYFASGFIGTLKWWIDRDIPCSIEEMDQLIKKIWSGTVREIV